MPKDPVSPPAPRQRRKPYYKYPQETLRHLHAQGDEFAGVALKDLYVVRSMAGKGGLFVKTPSGKVPVHRWSCTLGDGVTVEFQRDGGGLVRMLVEVREGTRRDHLVQHWQEIVTWRKRLTEWQGPSEQHGREGILNYLWQRRQAARGKRQPTYRELALEMNQAVRQQLEKFHSDAQALHEEERRGRLTKPGARFFWELASGRDFFGYDHALCLLGSLGFKPNIAKQWCDDALANLNNGQAAFSSQDDPVSPDVIRERLRTYRHRD